MKFRIDDECIELGAVAALSSGKGHPVQEPGWVPESAGRDDG
jgi:hypothetical protein